jgi:PhnB protein
MSIRQLTPYLFFNGTAEEAIKLYEQALDAKVEDLMRYKDMPPEAGTCPPEDQDRVMHATLVLGEVRLMLSDVTSDRPAPSGGQVELALELEDPEELARRFDALAASGEVKMAIHDAFWGDKFGALVDRFGIHWMLMCPIKKPA